MQTHICRLFWSARHHIQEGAATPTKIVYIYKYFMSNPRLQSSSLIHTIKKLQMIKKHLALPSILSIWDKNEHSGTLFPRLKLSSQASLCFIDPLFSFFYPVSNITWLRAFQVLMTISFLAFFAFQTKQSRRQRDVKTQPSWNINDM